jgi:hypothetical protein
MSANPQPSFEESLTDRQRELMNKLADRIVELRMSTPAILFLESVRPLNYVGSQVMVFFAPVVRGFLGLPEWDEVRMILERRESIGYFLDKIEEREGVALAEEQRLKAEKKTAKKAAKAAKKAKPE